MKEVKEKLVGLQEKVETHTEEIQQNKEKLDNVGKKVEKMERCMEDMEQQSEEGLLEELRAREAIKRNLVMYGLNEPHHSIKDGKDRMEADKEECEKVSELWDPRRDVQTYGSVRDWEKKEKTTGPFCST